MRSVAYFAVFFWFQITWASGAAPHACHEADTTSLSYQACASQLKLSGCDKYHQLVTAKQGVEFAKKQLVSCSESQSAFSKSSVGSCALFAGVAILQFSKTAIARFANGFVGTAMATMALKQGFEEDKKCFEDFARKKQMVNDYAEVISRLEFQYSIVLQELKPNRYLGPEGEVRLKNAPCQLLNEYFYERKRTAQAKLLNLTEGMFPEPGMFEALEEKITKEVADQGVHYQCLKPSVQAEMICDALALGTSIAGIGKSLLQKKNYSSLQVSENAFIKEAVQSVTPLRMRTPLPKDITKPSLPPSQAHVPEGKSSIKETNNKNLQRSREMEDQASASLAQAGYKVKVRAQNGAERKSVDLDVEGRFFDIYSPQSTSSAPRIVGHAISKAREGQTVRIILNMAESPLEMNELRMSFLIHRPDLQGVREVLAVTRSGEVVRVFP